MNGDSVQGLRNWLRNKRLAERWHPDVAAQSSQIRLALAQASYLVLVMDKALEASPL